MSSTEKIEVIRIDEVNYLLLSALLEWRRTGKKSSDPSFYDDKKMIEFFREFNILNSDMFYIFAAKQGNSLAGYINAVLIPKPDPRRGLLFVDELWVPEIYRNRGIASKLMDEVFRVARELDLWRVRLYVGSDNHAAREFYKKAGFVEKGDSIFCEWDVTR
ncbi:MAG: GNAT family N-acetyltransferase [Halanaerobium sp.]|nr:GNAT family N-acetyltransferase [Halanaerobium sp.]